MIYDKDKSLKKEVDLLAAFRLAITYLFAYSFNQIVIAHLMSTEHYTSNEDPGDLRAESMGTKHRSQRHNN